MKGGWLEHEIRSLPQVLACSVSKDDVVVLVQPSADPAAVERAVRDVLRRAGADAPVRVVGGVRPVFVEPMRVRNGRYALVGSIGGAAILAAGVWLTGAATSLRGPKSRATAAAVATPLPRELVFVPVVGGDGASAPLPSQEVTPPLLRPVRHKAILRPVGPSQGPTQKPPQTRPGPGPAPPPPAPQPPAPQPKGCDGLLDLKCLLQPLRSNGSLR